MPYSHRLLLAKTYIKECKRIRGSKSSHQPITKASWNRSAWRGEAAVHAARRFVGSMSADCVLAKLDFKNAFNRLYRDRMLAAQDKMFPELTPYCRLAYAEASDLRFGRYIISQVGPQQGDPLGPLLFCLPLQPILLSLSSPLVLGYLDDISLG